MPFRGTPAKGGKRENSGRNPDWLKAKCQNIIDKEKLVEFLADVARGKSFLQPSGDGTVMAPPPVRDRIKAVDMLLDRGFGKVPQPVDVGNKDGSPLVVQLITYANSKNSA